MPPCTHRSGNVMTRRNLDPIPLDVIFDIFTRLPVKSLSRFKCISMSCSSIISDPCFITTHFTRSLSRPSLLISFPNRIHLERFLFSADHPADDHHQEKPMNAIKNLTLSGFVHPYISESLNGLICVDVGVGLKICNPSTREFVTLLTTEKEVKSPPSYSSYKMDFFAFDPLGNDHKVLNTWVMKSSSDDSDNKMIMEHRVFTLGAYSWRRIEDGPPHFPATNGVCVNGTLYYMAWTSMGNPGSMANLGSSRVTVVAFDVAVEKFCLIRVPVGFRFLTEYVTLIQSEGRLGVVDYEHLRGENRMEMWVLEDPIKVVWSKKSFVFPSYWKELVGDLEFYLAGTIHTGEIILAPRGLSKPFYVFYYDMKRNNVRRVEIDGLPDYEFRAGTLFNKVTFTNHVESALSLSDLYY